MRLALILRRDETPAQFNGRTHLGKEAGLQMKQVLRVKISSRARQYAAQPVGARHLRRGAVPQHKLIVLVVEAVQVVTRAGAFLHGAKGHFTESPDLQQQRWRLPRGEHPHLPIALAPQPAMWMKLRHFER